MRCNAHGAALHARRAKDAQTAQDIARVGAVLRGEAPPLDANDPADRRAADTYYAEVLVPALANGSGVAANAGGAAPAGDAETNAPAPAARPIAEFADRTGIVPTAALTRAQAELSFGTPEDQAAAARFLDSLPGAVRGQIDPRDAARADVMAPLLDAGLPPELAARAATACIDQIDACRTTLITTTSPRQPRRRFARRMPQVR